MPSAELGLPDPGPSTPAGSLEGGARGWSFAGMLALGLLLGGLLLRFLAHLQTGGQPTLAAYAEAMCRWDCLWYVGIADFGYDPHPNHEGQAAWAFFPMLPMLLGLAQRLSGLPAPLVAMLLGAVAIWAAAVAAWPLFAGNRRAYVVGTALLLVGPGAVYFTTGYSESLFVLFTVLAFAALRRGDYAAAGLATACLSATRLVGVAMVLVIVLHAVLVQRGAGRGWRELPMALAQDGRLLFGIALAPLGLFAYMAWLYLGVGDALAFMRAQEAWGRYLDWPWLQLWEGLTSSFLAYVIWSISAIVGLLLVALLLARRRFGEGLYCGLGLVIPLASGVLSMPRFIAGQFPFYLLIAQMVSGRLWLAALAVLAVTVLGYLAAVGWLSDISYLT